MSLYVIEREVEWMSWGLVRGIRFGWTTDYEVRDCNEHDGEWYAFISLPHEPVEWEGREVPLFEGDVERREWESRRRGRLGMA